MALIAPKVCEGLEAMLGLAADCFENNGLWAWQGVKHVRYGRGTIIQARTYHV